MGAKDLLAAFNEVTSPTATASKALLDYDRANDTEWQILYFAGTYADGGEFAIKSDRLRPETDVNAAARETGRKFLLQKRD